MGYTNWKYWSTGRNNRTISYKICKDMWEDRGFKRKVFRTSDEDKRLPYRMVAPYTAVFYNEAKNCFVICTLGFLLLF